MKRVVLLFILFSVLGIGGLFTSVAVIDPFDHLALSPELPRARVSSNERWTFPGLIRNGNYDGALFGTSTSMLLHPDDLSNAFGGRIANLSMADSTAWEQRRMIDYFLRYHPDPGIVLVGIDYVWCDPTAVSGQTTFRGFPEWMYDDNPVNDYANLLNARVLVNSLRQVRAMASGPAPEYGPDGFFRFVPEDSHYDPEKGLHKIYGNRERPSIPTTPIQSEWKTDLPDTPPSYPEVFALATILGSLTDTRIILFFVPYHYSWIASSETWRMYEGCKQATERAFAHRKNTTIVDFMQITPVSTDDTNYWDLWHYRTPIAKRLVTALQSAAAGNPVSPDIGSVR